MPLDNQKPITNDFNIKSEQELQNRISPYNLNDNEKDQIWQIAAQRDKDLKAEDLDFNENYNDRVDNVLEQLKSDQKPKLEKDYTPQGAMTQRSDSDLTRDAHDKTKANFRANLQNIERDADKKINQILDKAREEGRGPQTLDQNRTLTQEFNRNR